MNMTINSLLASVFILLCTSMTAHANDELNTDWLKATTGSSGEKLGSEVILVRTVDDVMIIDVDIPADNLEDYETVVVIEKKSNKSVKLAKKPEILSDDDGDAYGIRLQIKRLPGFEFRLRLLDDSAEIIQ